MSRENGHWYTRTGEAMHFIAKKDGSGNRPTTLADARKLGLLPSVTHILKVLDKPALRDWLIRNAVMAVVTAPDIPGEDLDAKITRVLDTERQQDQESEIALDRGTQIHNALENAFQGTFPDPELWSWCEPAYSAIAKRGRMVAVEACVVGQGYGGKLDLIQETEHEVWLWDWKTSKKLPNPEKGGAWMEHRLQLSAYAAAWAQGDKPIRTGNVYISTVEPGSFCICEHGDWLETYQQGFKPLVQVWQYMNSFTPEKL